MVNKLKDCYFDVYKFCMKDQLNEPKLKQEIDASVKKEEYCDRVDVELPTSPPDSDHCSASYYNDAENCHRSFRQKFIKNKSDLALCS